MSTRPLVLLLSLALAGCDAGAPVDVDGDLFDGGALDTADAGPSTVIVETASGRVEGRREPGLLVFHGIPYAAPPIGDRRFAPPAPVEPWTETLDATGAGTACLSRAAITGRATGSEDCLHLNVWTPSTDGARPVMVWIHGGAFESGSGSDDLVDAWRIALEGDRVVVAINYRLGIFGSLAHPSLAAEGEPNGNWGALDQQAAVRWVRENARAFGGDPNDVTVFGHSAGGISTCLMALSPLADGLAERFIDQSGPCVIQLRTLDEAYELGARAIESVGCTGEDTAACLRAIDPDAMLVALTLPQQPGGMLYQEHSLPHRPTLDGVTFVEQPLDALRAGRLADASYVFGAARDEGTMFHHALISTPVEDAGEIRAALGRLVDLVPITEAQADAIAARYPVDAYPSANDAIAAATTDMFVCATRYVAGLTRDAGDTTYLYHFAQEPAHVAVEGLGVYHGADLIFLFGNDNVIGGTPDSAPELGPAMRGYWTRFAANGAPGGSPEWPAWTDDGAMRLHLAREITVEDGDPDGRCAFWDDVLDAL